MIVTVKMLLPSGKVRTKIFKTAKGVDAFRGFRAVVLDLQVILEQQKDMNEFEEVCRILKHTLKR